MIPSLNNTDGPVTVGVLGLFAAMRGFKTTILHGLWSFGIAVILVMAKFAAKVPSYAETENRHVARRRQGPV